jgi:hypothetical protein
MSRTLLLLAALVLLTALARADTPAALLPRVRIEDARLRRLLHEGLACSPTIRALLARLEESNVVVYVEVDNLRRMNVDGRLQFMSAVGDVRYVVIYVAEMPRTRQIAIMAHELQHAVEVAAAPQGVDFDSFAREFERIGHASAARIRSAYETDAARRAGEQVTRELRRNQRGLKNVAGPVLVPDNVAQHAIDVRLVDDDGAVGGVGRVER